MGIRIGYYPIKENEIKQVVKMVYSYYKKDNSYVEEVMKKHNVNENKKKDIFNSFDQCIQNKSNEYFDLCFGVCAAKVQKMYRGNFVLENKSITELMRKFPILGKYKTNLEDFIIFKNNKYKFVNALNFPDSSGVYLSYDNIEKLYNDYYFDITIKKAIDNYYGNNGTEYSNKFIEILDYCLKNKCGLLEANFLGEVETKKLESSINTVSINTKKVNNTNITKTKQQIQRERKIVSSWGMFWRILGYWFLWGFLAEIVVKLLLGWKGGFNGTIPAMIIYAIISIIVNILARIITWKLAINSSYKNNIILKSDIFKLLRKIAIFMIITTILSGVLKYSDYNKAIENVEKNNVNLKIKASYVNYYGTEELKKDYQKELEKSKKETEKILKPIYIGVSILEIIINIGVFLYVIKQVKKYTNTENLKE